SARDLSAGRGFTLARHPNHDGQAFVPLHVVHVAVNNLGHGITALLAAPDLERGSYRNRAPPCSPRRIWSAAATATASSPHRPARRWRRCPVRAPPCTG